MNVGVIGLGAALPPTIRKNDWWPRHVVDGWVKKKADSFVRKRADDLVPATRGQQLVVEALARYADDPYQGMTERRVVADGVTAASLEAEAARAAIADAGIDPKRIDFVLSYSMCIDRIQVPSACVVHDLVGLRKDCFSLEVDAVCNSFQTHLTVAEKMIKGGLGTYGLLVQSSTVTRLHDPMDEMSLFMGDGATAEVIGPVGEGRGVVSQAHFTDGRLSDALTCGVKGKNWWDEGRVYGYSPNGRSGREMLLNLVDCAQEAVGGALAKAGMTAADVDFYACHQPTAWLRQVTQPELGLSHARSLDTFAWAGTLSGANLPLVMHTARKEGTLRDGDVVAMFSGGTGMTWSGTVMKWGRGGL
jgi:3-oxoacyl-[acyl-carrier-protein] synthase III